jgi:hypothetical protein
VYAATVAGQQLGKSPLIFANFYNIFFFIFSDLLGALFLVLDTPPPQIIQQVRFLPIAESDLTLQALCVLRGI